MMCFREYWSSGPFFGRPKWLIRMTEPPSFMIFLMVGIAAIIRVSSVTISSLFNGTLKSTLNKAFRFLKLKSSMFFISIEYFSITKLYLISSN